MASNKNIIKFVHVFFNLPTQYTIYSIAFAVDNNID